MKRVILFSGMLSLMGSALWAADELCYATTDTALFADAMLSEEVRPIFQYDGAQFVPVQKDGETMFGAAYDIRMQPMLEENSYVRASDWTCEIFESSNDTGGDKVADVSAEACQAEFSDTRVTLSASSIVFFESTCDIAGEQAGSDGARLVSLQCYGEGMEWAAEAKISNLEDGGFEMDLEGQKRSYVYCN
jgi:hypothetical protein